MSVQQLDEVEAASETIHGFWLQSYLLFVKVSDACKRVRSEFKSKAEGYDK